MVPPVDASVGVIIGRFQVDELHDGHLQLLKYVSEHHPQVLILLGCRHSPATKTYPLDFRLRQQMIEQLAPEALILLSLIGRATWIGPSRSIR